MKIGPIDFGTKTWWRVVWLARHRNGYFGIFRNDHCVPGRWGFWILGFEFGSRNPRNKFGVWLKRMGLWRW